MARSDSSSGNWPTPEATDQFIGWFETLNAGQQASLNDAINLLHEYGPVLGEPKVKHLKTDGLSEMRNLKELRTNGTIRAFFAFDPRGVPILLVGGDKEGQNVKRWYAGMVRQATRLYRDHLAELASEGAIEPPTRNRLGSQEKATLS